jgi:hypothetical protein
MYFLLKFEQFSWISYTTLKGLDYLYYLHVFAAIHMRKENSVLTGFAQSYSHINVW